MNTILRNMLVALLVLTGFSFAVDVSTCQVISAPGTYVLTGDLTTDSGDCITIRSDDVDLYCNAHSVSATSGTGYAIYVTEGSDNVLVDRCLVENSMGGIRAGGPGMETHNLALRGNVARNNAFGYELIWITNSLIEGNTAWQNTHGFYMTASRINSIRENQAYLSSQNGFYFADSPGNRIMNNLAAQNNVAGIVVAFGSGQVYVEGNEMSDNGIGLSISGAGSGASRPASVWVTGNTITGSAESGILVSNTVSTIELSGNTIDGAGYGINANSAGSNFLIFNNHVRNTREAAALVSFTPDAMISSNTLEHGTGLGVADAGLCVGP
ncbi:MAG TPA: NosD domain-containing protein, partial [Candidatus Bilamarchaeaceae archaeon]|nr:NosD domain-containing protein [Candidatus Bilamarchaeaceae archaeon]